MSNGNSDASSSAAKAAAKPRARKDSALRRGIGVVLDVVSDAVAEGPPDDAPADPLHPATQKRARRQAAEDRATGPGRGETRGPALLSGELRSYLAAADAFDEAVADRLGINRTDLRCLDIIERERPITPSALAEHSGLTTGAVTFVLDRLERRGLITRHRDSQDRRRVFIELEEEADRLAWSLHAPLVDSTRKALKHFSPEQIDVIRDFVRVSRELYERHTPHVRDEEPPD